MCGSRLLATFDPEGDTYRCVRDNSTDVQLEAADESGALMIVKTIRLSVGPKSIQDGEWKYRGNFAPYGPYGPLSLNSLNMSVRLQFAEPNLHVNLIARGHEQVGCDSEAVRYRDTVVY